MLLYASQPRVVNKSVELLFRLLLKLMINFNFYNGHCNTRIKRIENILQSCQVDFQKSPSSDLIWRGTNLRPKKLAPLAKKLTEVDLACSKSSHFQL